VWADQFNDLSSRKALEVDQIIARLLSVSEKNPGTKVNLDYIQISSIIEWAKEIITSQPMLLRL